MPSAVSTRNLGVQHCDTEFGQSEAECTITSSSDHHVGSVYDVDSGEGVVVHVWVADRVGKVGEVGHSSRSNALELDAYRYVRVVGGVVDCALPDHSTVALLVVSSTPVERPVRRVRVRGECVGDRVVGEETPAVPGNGFCGALRVSIKLNECDGPLEAVVVLQNGCVEGTRDAIRVALVTDQGYGFTDSTLPPWVRVQVAFPADTAVDVSGCNFADNVASVVVEAVKLVDKLIRLTVWVVVTNCIKRQHLSIDVVGAVDGRLASRIAGGG